MWADSLSTKHCWEESYCGGGGTHLWWISPKHLITWSTPAQRQQLFGQFGQKNSRILCTQMIMIVIMIVTDDDDPSASLPRSPPSDLTRGLGGSSKNTWTPLTRILVCNLIIQCPVWSAPKENRRHSSVEGIKIIREPPPPPPPPPPRL